METRFRPLSDRDLIKLELRSRSFLNELRPKFSTIRDFNELGIRFRVD